MKRSRTLNTLGILFVLVSIVVVAAACSSNSSSPTIETTPPPGALPPSTQAPASKPSSQKFSGNGGLTLVTVTVPTDSTLNWTNDGGLFTVFGGQATYIAINSQAHSGSSAVPEGTYNNVQVNATGKWTIEIVPK